MKEEHEKNKKKEINFTEGMLIAVVPAVLYALGFSYEAGFLSFFDIPLSLISVDKPALFSVALFGAIYVYVLLMWLSMAADWSKNESNSAKSIGLMMSSFGFLLILYLLTKGTEYLSMIMYSCFILIIVVKVLSSLEKKFPLLEKISIKTHKTLSSTLTEEKSEDSQLALIVLNKVSALFIISLIPFYITYVAGRNNAADNTKYSTIKHDILGDLAVVRIYGESIVAVPYDKQNKEFGGRYVITDLKSLNNSLFFIESIGPLHRK